MLYTDRFNKIPLNSEELKYLILDADFYTAWYFVQTHIMKADVQPFHKRMMKHQLENKNSLIMATRGCGKSYCLTTGFCLTHILRNPNITIAVITAGSTQSEAFIGEMKQYFEENSIIWEIFGDLKGDKWNASEFCVKRDKIIKEATVTAGSMTSSSVLISKHFQLIILDDIVSVENSQSQLQRQKLENFMNQTVFPLLELQYEDASIKAIGTYYHYADYWHTLEESSRFKNSVLKIPCWRKNKKGILESIWEWKLPLKTLKEYATDLGRTAFNYQYLMKSPKGEGGIFKRRWLNYFSDYKITDEKVIAKTYSEEQDGILKNSELKLYMGVDLAIGKNKENDRTVISVIGIDSYSNIYLLFQSAKRLSFRETVQEIKRIYNMFPNIIRVGIESVAYQEAMAQEARDSIPGIPVLKIKTTKDKKTRFEIFSAQFEAGKVYLYSKLSTLDLLESEMLEFGSAPHDDTIDSFCIAYETYRFYRNHDKENDFEKLKQFFL